MDEVKERQSSYYTRLF
ncbi:hypothetical protein [Bacillus sp. FSL M8-0473]